MSNLNLTDGLIIRRQEQHDTSHDGHAPEHLEKPEPPVEPGGPTMWSAMVKKPGPMTLDHALWEDFMDGLYGEEGCNFHLRNPDDMDSVAWTCDRSGEFPKSQRILGGMGLTPDEIKESLEDFRQNNASCDCEVFLNVDCDRLPQRSGER